MNRRTLLPALSLAMLAASDAPRAKAADVIVPSTPGRGHRRAFIGSSNQKAAKKRKRNRRNPQFTHR